MSAETFLSSCVEVAIGMGGFAGIVAAVRQRNIRRWPTEQRLLLEMLLVAAAVAIVFSLLPLVLAEAKIATRDSWRLGSIGIFVTQSALAFVRTRQFRASGWTGSFPLLLQASVTTIALLQVLNIYLCTAWPYLLGVFGFLANGFYFFLRLLLGEPTGEDDDVMAREASTPLD